MFMGEIVAVRFDHWPKLEHHNASTDLEGHTKCFLMGTHSNDLLIETFQGSGQGQSRMKPYPSRTHTHTHSNPKALKQAGQTEPS